MMPDSVPLGGFTLRSGPTLTVFNFLSNTQKSLTFSPRVDFRTSICCWNISQTLLRISD